MSASRESREPGASALAAGPHLPGALRALLRTALQTMIQYRGEVALWALWGFVFPAVSLTMWSAALPAEGQISGYTRGDFAAYFLLTMVVMHFTTAWDIYEMGHQVRSGALSSALLRPLLPMWSSLCDNTAYKVVTLAFIGPVWLVFAWLVEPRLTATPVQLMLGLVSLVFASALNYLLGYTLALVAFWTTRTDAIGESWFGAGLLFGGRFAPLALLPMPLQWVAACLPFKWMAWFPAEMLMGRIAVADGLLGLAAQAGWLTATVVAFRLTWRAALRHYSAVGG